MFVKGGKPGPGRGPWKRDHISPEVKAIEHKRVMAKRKSNALAAIDNPGLPLRPWMKVVALWIAQQPRKPKKADLLTRARTAAHCRLTMGDINRLLVRPDFQHEVEELMTEAGKQAKAMFVSQMPKAIETHFESMQALANAGEHKEVAKFTAPYIERAYPTKTESGNKSPTIVINLGSDEFSKKYLPQPVTGATEEIVIEADEVTVIAEEAA